MDGATQLWFEHRRGSRPRGSTQVDGQTRWTLSAGYYNHVRRIVFSIAQNPSRGFSEAYDLLETGYRAKLGSRGYRGLLAELRFYERYRREFKLTIAGDMGEHADFAGQYGSAVARFDVTTNLGPKRLGDYEPFLSDGPEYKIVVVDPTSGDIAELVSLAFRQCKCGGYFLPTFILLDRETTASVANDQLLVEICAHCEEVHEVGRHAHHFMPSLSEVVEGQEPESSSRSVKRRVKAYGLDVYKWLRREYCDELMAVAGMTYTVTDSDGDGYWACKTIFKNSVVGHVFPDPFALDGLA